MPIRPVPVPYRITMALGDRYGPEVDHACGVEEPAVDQWETGERIPTPEQIELLARYTDYPVDFFYRAAPEPMRGTAFMCRRTGPKKDRCQQIELGPPAFTQEVIPMASTKRPALPYGWRCSIRPCSLRGRRYPTATEQEAIDALNFHYDAQHAGENPEPAERSTQ